MKIILWLIVIVIATVLFGTVPLYVLSYVFDFLGTGLRWLAKLIDLFGIAGALSAGGVL